MKDIYTHRKYIVQGLIALVGFIFIAKLFYIQVIDDSYKVLASENVVRKIVNYPTRGLIYDRNGKLVVVNNAIYDLMVVPSQVDKEMDTLKFCEILGITRHEFNEQMGKARKYSRYKPSVFIKQISRETNARFEENLFQFPGYYSQVRTIRSYPYRNAAHILGYIGEVNQRQIEASDSYYRPGDYIGINGLEKIYEKKMRGRRGTRYVMVDVHNREQGSYKNGAIDTPAISGSDLVLTLDIDLQSYGEKLMQNKKGSIVVLDPKTGEILAMISSPSYDPNLLSGRDRGKNFSALINDTLKPLFNRPIMANYPPGSTFKPIMALVAMQEKAISPYAGNKCTGGYYVGRFKMGCHVHEYIDNVQEAIQHSCNAYFANAFRKMIDHGQYDNVEKSLDLWADYLNKFGLGHKMNIDLPNESSGNIPTSAVYNKIYSGHKWKSLMVVSLGIGQGEMGVTPLQQANMISVVANRGYYITPHLAKEFRDDPEYMDSLIGEKHYVEIDEKYFDLVKDGMEKVVTDGTARMAKIPEITMCGKTGTAENPHGEDHSVFVAFAPKEDPRVAVSVFVENAGFGSTYAAPIASLMIEKHLNDTIADSRKWLENRMLEADLINPEKLAVNN